MREFELRRTLYDREICVRALLLEGGLHISIFGGDLPHIGAVSIVLPEGGCRTTQFPGHRDGAVSERWARTLSAAGHRPAVVEAGIHYDGLTRQGIADVLALTDNLLTQVLDLLTGGPASV